MSRPLALTMGEPAGIGPDITLAAWLRRRELDLPAFYVLADPQCLARRAKRLGLDVPIEVVTPGNAATIFARALPVVALGLPATAEPGKPDTTSAPAAIASIDRAVADVISGMAAAVVTNPVAKSVLYTGGFTDPGHTEYLAKLSFQQTGNPAWPVMMLWSPEVAVVPVTIHVPFKEVPQRLTRDLIFETGRVVARDLIDRFGIAQPRLAIAGLNPHAGEEGTMGKEDATIVRPAI
jgi:4-hydroxythreonine-4-phosphate dehydrogenase